MTLAKISVLALAAPLLASLALTPNPSHAGELEEANKRVVQRVFDEFYNGRNVETLSEYMAEDLIQHNQEEPDGSKGLVEFFEKNYWSKGVKMDAKIIRIIAEGDLVFTQSRWAPPGNNEPFAKGSFAIGDIYRVKDGKLVEHWDIGQPVPESSVNGNSMFDGGTFHPEPKEVQQANKKVVLAYFQEALNKRNYDALDDIVSNDWIAHNPIEKSGREELKNLFRGFVAQIPEIHADTKRLIAEGNFVVAHNHYTLKKKDRGNDFAQPSGATFDIFRLEKGVIVEHWDIGLQGIPAKSVSGRSMFDGSALYNYKK